MIDINSKTLLFWEYFFQTKKLDMVVHFYMLLLSFKFWYVCVFVVKQMYVVYIALPQVYNNNLVVIVFLFKLYNCVFS